MAIETTTRKSLFDGDGSTTTFSVPFKFLDNSHLVVILVDESTNAETVQTITTHYSITGDGGAGSASVVFVTAPTTSQKVSIYRDTEILQPYELFDNEAQTATNVEAALDRLTMIAQELEEGISRTIQRSVTVEQVVFPSSNLAVTDVFLGKITGAPTGFDHPFQEEQPVAGASTNQVLTGGRTGTLKFVDNCADDKSSEYTYVIQMLDTEGATVYRSWQAAE